MIRFEQVSKRYPGGFTALNQINFELKKGQWAFLTGHSGAGKSTLLRLLLFTERATSGRLFLADQNVADLRMRDLPRWRRQMGFVFQDHRLLFDRTVFENVALPMEIGGFEYREIRRRVRAALDKVGLLNKERLMPAALSSGEQQRVGIARAVVNRPGVLLADEPTGNLDPLLSLEIMKLFQEFQRVGVCVLIASHDLSLIAQLKTRVLTLHQGFLISDQSSSFDLRKSEIL